MKTFFHFFTLLNLFSIRQQSSTHYKQSFICISNNSWRTLAKSPEYLMVPLPSLLDQTNHPTVWLSLSHLSPFKLSVKLEHPVCRFTLLVPCRGHCLLCREAEESEGEEDRKRQLLPAHRWGKRRRQRWRPNLWLWLSSHYNQTGTTRRRGECVITLKSPMTKTEDNKQG